MNYSRVIQDYYFFQTILKDKKVVNIISVKYCDLSTERRGGSGNMGESKHLSMDDFIIWGVNRNIFPPNKNSSYSIFCGPIT